MKRILLSVLIATSLISARAADHLYSVHFDGPSESPPNASPGIGDGTVDYNDATHFLTLQAVFTGLTGTTTVTTPHGQVITVPVIEASGSMLFETANEWITASNQISYAGTNNWSLPAITDVLTLFNHLGLVHGDTRLTVQGGAGPFQNLQPFFYWACVRDQTGDSRSPCNNNDAAPNLGGVPFAFSYNLENGFQATDLENKAFYVAVYYPQSRAYLPLIFNE